MSENILANLKKEAQRIEEDCLYSAKGHFEASKLWNSLYYWLGIPTTILAGIGGVSLVAETKTPSAIIAGIVSISVAISTFLNPMEKSTKHLASGNAFNVLRGKFRFFREINSDIHTVLESKEKLEQLISSKEALNKVSLRIPRRSFESARKGIEQGEAQYQADN